MTEDTQNTAQNAAEDATEVKEEAPAETQKKEKSSQKAIVLLLCGILAVLILTSLPALQTPIRALWRILYPIIIGAVIAYVCNPVLRIFETKVFKKIKRRRVNRGLSMLVTYLLLAAVLAGTVLLIVPNVLDSLEDLRNNSMGYVNSLIDSVNRFVESLPFRLPSTGDEFLTFEKLLTFLLERMTDYGSQMMGGLRSFASSAITVLKNILVGIFVSIYMLVSKDRLAAGVKRAIRALFGDKQEKLVRRYISAANKKFGGFILGKMWDSFLIGVICLILLLIFKIPYPVLISVIVGVTNFIPFFGPFIGAIPSALIIFIASPSKALVFIILIFALQQFDGNLLGPYILGDSTGLTSLGVLIAITLMSGLLGFVGMLIGVPLFALLMIMLNDLVVSKLEKKGASTALADYYDPNAFIKLSDEADETLTATKRFANWIRSVESEEITDGKPHRFSRWFRRACLAVARFAAKFLRRGKTKKQS